MGEIFRDDSYGYGVNSEFNVPMTSRSYKGRTSFESLIQKSEEARD